MDGKPNIQLLIQSSTLLLSGVRELVFHVASRVGFTDEHCGQMALAVDEALCNVIRHGYDRAADRPIWLSIFFLGGLEPGEGGKPSPTEAIKIIIEDEAKQVDLEAIKSRDLDEIRPGGLGVHIIQQVMDEVRYEHRQDLGAEQAGRGMRLIMVKRKDSTAGAGPEEDGAEGHGGTNQVGGNGGGHGAGHGAPHHHGTRAETPIQRSGKPGSQERGS